MTDLPTRVTELTQGLLALGSGDDAVKSAVVDVAWDGHGHAAAAAGLARADTGAPMRTQTQFGHEAFFSPR